MTGVIYARYSSDNQREESIEGQLRECKAFAEKNDIQIVGTCIDRALSAKTDNRPDFQRMIKDSEKGMFDTVIVRGIPLSIWEGACHRDESEWPAEGNHGLHHEQPLQGRPCHALQSLSGRNPKRLPTEWDRNRPCFGSSLAYPKGIAEESSSAEKTPSPEKRRRTII